MVGAEMPTNSDLIKWAEQGRLHTKYNAAETSNAAGATNATDVPWLTGPLAAGSNPACNFKVGQTIFISENGGSTSNKAIVTAVGALTTATCPTSPKKYGPSRTCTTSATAAAISAPGG